MTTTNDWNALHHRRTSRGLTIERGGIAVEVMPSEARALLVALAEMAEGKPHRINVCGVDCHRGDDRCNGYCIGKAPRAAAPDERFYRKDEALSHADKALIDEAWKRHKATTPCAHCGIGSGLHNAACPADVRPRDGSEVET